MIGCLDDGGTTTSDRGLIGCGGGTKYWITDCYFGGYVVVFLERLWYNPCYKRGVACEAYASRPGTSCRRISVRSGFNLARPLRIGAKGFFICRLKGIGRAMLPAGSESFEKCSRHSSRN